VYICVRDINFALVSTIFFYDFVIDLTVWYFLVFHLIIQVG